MNDRDAKVIKSKDAKPETRHPFYPALTAQLSAILQTARSIKTELPDAGGLVQRILDEFDNKSVVK